MDDARLHLFAYGTLRQEGVQLALFGRKLDGAQDSLPGYKLSPLEITDAAVIAASGTAHHTICQPTGNPADTIPGLVFQITVDELGMADEYEVAECKRITVRLASGTEAYTYVSAK